MIPIKLFEVYAELGFKNDKFNKGITEADKKGKELATSFGGIGKAVGIAAAASVTAVSVAVGALAKIGVTYNAQMENYTTNFTTMLGSQEKAVKRVEELKQMAAKTPFGMEDLAKSTETLLAFGVNANKTTDIMRMLGDVSLGNKAKFSGLTLSFAQMSATGRLMGQDLLQMVNAGFNPLQIISEQTGKTMATLKKEMENGAISTDMVTEAFKIATSEGGKFYKGMQAASKTLSGQFSTLQDDIKSVIGEGFLPFNKVLSSSTMPYAIRGVQDLQRAFADPTFKKAIQSLAESAGEFAKGIIDFAVKAAPLMAKGLAFVANNAKPLTIAIGGLTAAIIAQKAANVLNNAELAKGAFAFVANTAAMLVAKGQAVASTVSNVALAVSQGGVTAAVLAASVAWKALTTAMSANYIGLIIAGVAALAVGVFALTKAFSKQTDEQKAFAKELDRSKAALDDYNNGLADINNTHDESIKTWQNTANVAKKLEKEIASLGEKTNKTAANEALMAEKVAQLNKLLPDQNFKYNAVSKTIEGLNGTLKNYISINGEAIRQEAQRDKAIELLKSQQLALDELAIAEMNYAEAVKNNETIRFNETKNGLAAIEAKEKWTLAVKESSLAVEQYDKVLEKTSTTQSETTTKMQEWQEKQAANIEASKIKITELSNTYGVSAATLTESFVKSGLSADEWHNKQSELLSSVKTKYTDYFDTVSNGFERLTQNSTISLNEFLANMHSNQEAVANWNNNVNTLMAAGIDGGIIARLEKLGPQGAEQAQRFVNELNTLNNNADISLGVLNDQTRSKLDEIKSTFDVGAKTASQAAIDQFKREEYVNAGTRGIDEISARILLNTSLPTAITSQMENAAAAAAGGIPLFAPVGTEMANGVASGIASGASGIATALTTAVSGALSKARNTMQIHSPSRVIAKLLGLPIAQGAAVGIDSGAGEVESSLQNMLDPIYSLKIPKIGIETDFTSKPAVAKSQTNTVTSVNPVFNFHGNYTPSMGEEIMRQINRLLGKELLNA